MSDKVFIDTWPILIPDVPVVLDAIRGRKAHNLSYWDALRLIGMRLCIS